MTRPFPWTQYVLFAQEGKDDEEEFLGHMPKKSADES